VIVTITNTGHLHLERFQQKQTKLDQLTKLGSEDAANFLREPDKKYSISKLCVPAGIQLYKDDNALALPPTTF
jgi:hypothetical protein